MPVYKSLDAIFEVLQNKENLASPEIEELLTIHQAKKYPTVFVKRHALIVFEGLDGSGKSTIPKIINESIVAKIVSTPPECVKHLRPYFDSKPAELRAAFYSLSNYIAAEEIKVLLNESIVLLDRFWHSTCAIAVGKDAGKVSNLPHAGSEFYEWPKDLLKPDAVIFLNVPEHMRIERLSRRSNYTAEEDELKHNDDFRNACIVALKRMRDPRVTTVMSIKSPKQVARFTLNKLISMGLEVEMKPMMDCTN